MFREAGTMFELERLEKMFACWVPFAVINDRVGRKIGEKIVRLVLIVEEDAIGCRRSHREATLSKGIGRNTMPSVL